MADEPYPRKSYQRPGEFIIIDILVQGEQQKIHLEFCVPSGEYLDGREDN